MPNKTDIIEFDAHKVRNYLDQSINGFMNDPPDTDYQRGFLAAVLIVWKEALNKGDDARIPILEGLL